MFIESDCQFSFETVNFRTNCIVWSGFSLSTQWVLRPDKKANESQTESAEKRSSRPSPWSITTVWQTQVIPSTLQHIPGLPKLIFINLIVLNLSYHTDGWQILLIRSIQFPKICVLLLAILLNLNDLLSLYYAFSENLGSSIIIIIWFKNQYILLVHWF